MTIQTLFYGLTILQLGLLVLAVIDILQRLIGAFLQWRTAYMNKEKVKIGKKIFGICVHVLMNAAGLFLVHLLCGLIRQIAETKGYL